jgi:integrase
MNDKAPFVSVLGPTITQYLALKQALGRGYYGECRVLVSLDAFLATQGSDLTSDSFARWCQSQEHVRSGVRRHRMRIVRNLTLYRRRREPSCFVPDPAFFPPLHQPARPYIFTHGEIARLYHAAKALEPSRLCPLRAEVFSLAIALLYTTGLRRGELLRMTIGDYDPREKTLFVRKSKFHKSRLLPLSPDGAHLLARYLQARRVHRLTVAPETPLIGNHRSGGRAYTGVGFGQVVRHLFDTSGIRKPDGHLPRIHDIRHTFALHALLRWYLAGADVQARLPFLSIYMGHVSIVSTQHYLQLIEPLTSSASKRFASRCAGLIEPLPAYPEDIHDCEAAQPFGPCSA